MYSELGTQIISNLHITISKLTLLWLRKFPSFEIINALLYDDVKWVSCSSDTRSQVGERVKPYPLLVILLPQNLLKYLFTLNLSAKRTIINVADWDRIESI